jgi:hypothetical protein
MNHHYTACYCEENIWHLCTDESVPGTNRQVVWIGSLESHCPLWCQRASQHASQPVWWDYHVILLTRTTGWQVWDLDTTLPLPLSAAEYFQHTFHPQYSTQTRFRVMSADYYLQHFSSDRSHMRDAENNYLSPPPPWPAIGNGVNTISEMFDFGSAKHGQLMTLSEVTAAYK